MIKLYDKVLLKTGETASIVEVLKDGKTYVADIDKSDGTDTDFIYADQIESVLH